MNIDFAEGLIGITKLEAVQTINKILQNTELFHTYKVLTFSPFNLTVLEIFWLCGNSRYERVLLSSLYITAQSKQYVLKSYIDDNFQLVVGSNEASISYIINNINPKEIFYSPYRREAFTALITPAAEEFAAFCALAFQFGYPRITEFFRNVVLPEVDPQKALEYARNIHEYAQRQQAYNPHPEYLKPGVISEDFLVFIYRVRKLLLNLYGFTAEWPYSFSPLRAQKTPLHPVTFDLGVPRLRTNNQLNYRHKDIMLRLIEEVKEYGSST